MAEAPLSEAENLFRQTGPALITEKLPHVKMVSDRSTGARPNVPASIRVRALLERSLRHILHRCRFSGEQPADVVVGITRELRDWREAIKLPDDFGAVTVRSHIAEDEVGPPSPLVSPTPASMSAAGDAGEPMLPAVKPKPCISHPTTCPVGVLNTISSMPSPMMSPLPTT
jgi:hypothetical protein